MKDLNSVNEYGTPLHACHGHRHDAHWWEWLNWVVTNCEKVGYDGIRVYYRRKNV